MCHQVVYTTTDITTVLNANLTIYNIFLLLVLLYVDVAAELNSFLFKYLLNG